MRYMRVALSCVSLGHFLWYGFELSVGIVVMGKVYDVEEETNPFSAPWFDIHNHIHHQGA